MSADELLDLGLAESIVPEAIGRPGERKFKITVISHRGSATIWMEKEQLFQVAAALKQFLSSRSAISNATNYVSRSGDPLSVISEEFRAGDMSLSHDARSDVFTVAVTDIESEHEGDDEEDAVAMQFSFTRVSADKIADVALQVVAAGRKPCPLCSVPQDPKGHFCVRKNGRRNAHTDEV